MKSEHSMISTLIEHLNRHWCRTFHSMSMWPIHGRYRCLVCQRDYPVQWDVQAYETGRFAEHLVVDNAVLAPRYASEAVQAGEAHGLAKAVRSAVAG